MRAQSKARMRGGVADDTELEAGIEAILAKAGLFLLEFSLSRHRGSLTVKAVVYSPAGTGTEECAKAHRLMLPQIQIACGIQSPNIEISSPGIDRIIRAKREWKAFVGRFVRLLPRGENDWIEGKLTGFGETSIEFEGPGGLTTIDIDSIAKARLDSSHKGE